MRNKQSRPGIRGLVLLAAAVLLLGAAALYGAKGQQGGMEERREADAAAAGASDELEQLWAWIDPSLQGGAASAIWALRWDGVLGGGSQGETGQQFDSEQQLAQLLAELRLADAQAGEGPIETRWEGRSGEGRLVATVVPDAAAGRQELVVLWTGTSSSLAGLQINVRHIEQTIEKALSDNFTRSLTFYGTAEAAGAAEQVAMAADAELVDEYEDGGTSSRSYHTAAVANSIQYGSRAFNLQLAEHRDAASGNIALVGGIPFINGDYDGSGLKD